MMQWCLLASLTEDTNACLLPHCSEYTSDAASGNVILALVLFKTIMRLAIIDNKTTMAQLHENLNCLAEHLVKYNSIKKIPPELQQEQHPAH